MPSWICRIHCSASPTSHSVGVPRQAVISVCHARLPAFSAVLNRRLQLLALYVWPATMSTRANAAGLLYVACIRGHASGGAGHDGHNGSSGGAAASTEFHRDASGAITFALMWFAAQVGARFWLRNV